MRLSLSNGFGAAISWADRLDWIRFHDSINRQNDGHAATPQLPYRNLREILKLRMLQTFSNVVLAGHCRLSISVAFPLRLVRLTAELLIYLGVSKSVASVLNHML
jgi:hypothetical protein